MTVQEMNQAKEESASVGYQKFVLLTSITSDSLFCFFENKDAPYYGLRIKQYYNGNHKFISCGNKDKVLKTHKIIRGHKEYDKYKLAFFIDRDFDDSVKDKYQDIYETPCYSIENLYSSTSLIKDLIKTDFQIGEEEATHNNILILYKKMRNEFLSESLLFNAWYKLQKTKAKKLRVKIEICLDNSLIPNFIEFDLDSIRRKYTLDFIRSKYPDALEYSSTELDNVVKDLLSTKLRYSLRGKFIFNFVTTFIRKLVEDSSDKAEQKIIKRKVKYNMDNSTALTLLTCYAETPKCLIDFLKRYN